MKEVQITEYHSNDGRVFRSAQECKKHEMLVEQISLIIEKLPPKPTLSGCSFENGGGYVQHSKHDFEIAKKELLSMALSYLPKTTKVKVGPYEWISSTMEDNHRQNVDPSWATKAIDDCCPSPIKDAWHRFHCTDNKYREWGQTYFAYNPDKGSNNRLN